MLFFQLIKPYDEICVLPAILRSRNSSAIEEGKNYTGRKCREEFSKKSDTSSRSAIMDTVQRGREDVLRKRDSIPAR